MRVIALLALLAALSFAPRSHASIAPWNELAGTATASLSKALTDAARGRPAQAKLTAAVAAFDRLLETAPLSPRDRARVLYNRGIAHLELGNAGAAVLDLRRSDALAPGVPETQRELAAARARAATPVPSAAPSTSTSTPATTTSPRAQRDDLLTQAWHAVLRADIGGRGRWLLGLAGVILTPLLLGVRIVLPAAAPRRVLACAAAAAFLLSLAGWGMLSAEHLTRTVQHDVVVTAPACTPRQGPDALAYGPARLGSRDTLPPGAELIVIETRADPQQPDVPVWLRVRERTVTPGVEAPTAWVAASDIGWVSPPMP